MELILLDEDFNTMRPINIYSSLIWDRRYFEPGIFELHMDDSYYPLLANAKYLYRNDRPELGRITVKRHSESEDGSTDSYIKGSFAEDILNDRVVGVTASLSGTQEVIARQLITDFFISPEDTDREIDFIRLGELQGLGESVHTQTTGSQVGEYIYSLLRTKGLSPRMRFEYLENLLYFDVWEGKDRTEDQAVNSWALFSNDFHNVKSMEYDFDESEEKNYVYIAGAGEGTDRTVAELDLRSGDEPRKELYVDARDIQRAEGQTEEEYQALLLSRGAEKAASYVSTETLDAEIIPDANLTYMVDFDLGDLCTYKNTDIDIIQTARITEIIETYEPDSSNISVVFGDGYISSIKKFIQREVK